MLWYTDMQLQFTTNCTEQMSIGLYFFFCSMNTWTGAVHLKKFSCFIKQYMSGNSNTDIFNLLEIFLGHAVV